MNNFSLFYFTRLFKSSGKGSVNDSIPTNEEIYRDLTAVLMQRLKSYVSSSDLAEGIKLIFCPVSSSCTMSLDGIIFTFYIDDGAADIYMEAAFAQARLLPPACVKKLKVWKIHVEWNYRNQAGISKCVDVSVMHDHRYFQRRVDEFVGLAKGLSKKQQAKRVVSLSRKLSCI